MVMVKAASLQKKLRLVSKIHFFYLLAFGLSLLVYNAWKLITPDSLRGYWIIFAVIALILAFVWLKMESAGKKPVYYKRLLWLMIIADIALATFVIYAQRGIASRGVALFAIPIALSTVFGTKLALFLASLLSTAAYIVTALIYAAIFPREGYKIELYGTLVFYSVTFFLLAALLWVLARNKNS